MKIYDPRILKKAGVKAAPKWKQFALLKHSFVWMISLMDRNMQHCEINTSSITQA